MADQVTMDMDKLVDLVQGFEYNSPTYFDCTCDGHEFYNPACYYAQRRDTQALMQRNRWRRAIKEALDA